MDKNSLYDLIVIGGGAAGIFTAVNAARLQPSWKVVVLEKSSKLLSKVKVSGGGRCNVTHACFDKRLLATHYPRGEKFVKQYAYQFFTTDTIQWFEERGVVLKTESDGRMFPVTNNSQTIIEALLREATIYGVEFRLNALVESINPHEEKFVVQLVDKRKLEAIRCCIATGGFPKLSQYDWMQPLGHTIVPPVPSLFTFNAPAHSITKLMGISVRLGKVKIAGTKMAQTGPILITHWGLSGPAILKLSAWAARELQACNYQFSIQINWLEGEGWNAANLGEYFTRQRINHPTQLLKNSKMFQLPQRLWEFFLQEAGIVADTQFANLAKKQENKLVKLLTDMEMLITGKTTFKEEFVTAGGVSLQEIDCQTMQSKLLPHLYFAGEIMDIDGVTGGFNFQHAWASGYLAAKAMTTVVSPGDRTEA
jgi:predicted Rossmann fold flavoprotein